MKLHRQSACHYIETQLLEFPLAGWQSGIAPLVQTRLSRLDRDDLVVEAIGMNGVV